MNNGRPIYSLQGLTKAYNGRLVLDLPALDIHAGEIFALVGPSGSGKSTLLRLLNFLEPSTQGTIIFDQVALSNGKEVPLELRRRVTTVFQRPLLLNDSVWNNVTYGLRLRGERDLQARTQHALEEVGLEKLAHQRARTLSGGEAQRVALARAMVLQPDVLLLDEPTANLDPYNVGLIEQIARRLNEQQGTTLVLVTHNVFQAHRLAQRVALLLEGKLVEVAPADQFFNAPAEARTRAFVQGDMVY
jgi:tungstate transport system ATP-binding protein